MQANQHVYRLGVVGGLRLTDCCGRYVRLPLSKRPERAILNRQPSGIGGMFGKCPRDAARTLILAPILSSEETFMITFKLLNQRP